MEVEFNQTGTFMAYYAAHRWCDDNGYSYAPMCHPEPTAIMKGDWIIAKWRNLTAKERRESHGYITGNFREGPVKITIKQKGTE